MFGFKLSWIIPPVYILAFVVNMDAVILVQATKFCMGFWIFVVN